MQQLQSLSAPPDAEVLSQQLQALSAVPLEVTEQLCAAAAEGDVATLRKHAAMHGGFVLLRPRSAAFATPRTVAGGHAGNSPAHHASKEGQQRVLEELHALAPGSGVLTAAGEAGATPAIFAAMHGHVACLETIHELCGPEALRMSAARGATAAHAAAMEGEADALRALARLLGGADARAALEAAAGEHRMRPVHEAATHGHLECLQVIADVCGGGALRAATAHGTTPLLMAVRHRSAECAQLILRLAGSQELLCFRRISMSASVHEELSAALRKTGVHGYQECGAQEYALDNGDEPLLRWLRTKQSKLESKADELCNSAADDDPVQKDSCAVYRFLK